MTLERGTELMEAKLAGIRQNILKEFPDTEIQVLSGRYGPYITDGKKIANVPKEKEPTDVTLEEATALLEAAPARNGKGRKGKTAAKKEPAKKKAAPKKKAAKKAAPKKAAKKAAKKAPKKER